MSNQLRTVRLYVPIKDQPLPVVFSVRDLMREQRQDRSRASKGHDQAQGDEFFRSLLQRTMRDNAETGGESTEEEEEGPISKRPSDYDYSDPFIDDSDLYFDAPMPAPDPEHQGFFVFHGSLDGNSSDAKRQEKSKSAVKPVKSSSTTKTKEAKVKAAAAVSTAAKKDKPKIRKSTSTEKQRKEQPKETPPAATTTTTASSSVPKVATPTEKATQPTRPTTRPETPSAAAAAAPAPAPASAPAPARVASSPRASAQIAPRAQVSRVFRESKTPEQEKSAAKSKKGEIVLLPLDPDIHRLMEKLRIDAARESFTYKARFPANLRPTTLEIGRLMFQKNDCIDDNVIHHLMQILPYNKFTLKKFLTTKSGRDRLQQLQSEVDQLIKQLKTVVDEMMPEQMKQHREKVVAAIQVQRGEGAEDSKDNNEEPGPLTAKFQWDDTTRSLLYDILKKDQAAASLANDIAQYSQDPNSIVSDVKDRSEIYLKLIKCWPPGWMTTTQLSQEHSKYNIKLQKERRTPSSDSESAIMVADNASSSSPSSSNRPLFLPSFSANEMRKREREQPDNNEESRKRHATSSTSNQSMMAGTANNPLIIDQADDNENQARPSSRPQSSTMKIDSLISHNRNF